MTCCNPCGSNKLMFAGQVMHGNKYPHKAPTANISHGGLIKPGVYVGCAFLMGEESDESETCLGRCLVWVAPNNVVAEVYISEYEGDLYGEIVKVKSMRALDRAEMREGYDLFLTNL